MKKLFGGVDLSWKKLILFAVIMGVFTALVSRIPQLKDTSFHTIAVTFEVWIPIGIFIIMNSKSNIDSALKCFVFFLISQPLVYLLQVPFSPLGWELFKYYPYWFKWTLFCIPMGFIGYFIKKDKWWGYLILLPMIALTAISYYQYLRDFTFCYPYFSLISLFCAAMMIIYPNVLFSSKKVKMIGTIISVLIVAIITVIIIINPYRYSTDILSTCNDEDITSEYQVSLADDKYGDVVLTPFGVEGEDICLVHAEFKRMGKTELIITTPAGEKVEYDLVIRLDTYSLTKK